jgi:hypothetical protein
MVSTGVLFTYGLDIPDIYRQAADYVDRILRGTKPADLLLSSLHAARALGLNVPGTLLARADEVIEWDRRRQFIAGWAVRRQRGGEITRGLRIRMAGMALGRIAECI